MLVSNFVPYREYQAVGDAILVNYKPAEQKQPTTNAPFYNCSISFYQFLYDFCSFYCYNQIHIILIINIGQCFKTNIQCQLLNLVFFFTNIYGGICKFIQRFTVNVSVHRSTSNQIWFLHISVPIVYVCICDYIKTNAERFSEKKIIVYFVIN